METIPIKILLVEDNPGDILLTREAFKSHKIRNNLYVVQNGFDALAFLKREGIYAEMPLPDLILLDLHLPKKDGYQVLTEIQGNSLFSMIPVFVFMGMTPEDEVSKVLGLGAKFIIPKPLEPKDFITKINQLKPFWITIATTGEPETNQGGQFNEQRGPMELLIIDDDEFSINNLRDTILTFKIPYNLKVITDGSEVLPYLQK